ncbi:hypothetical protein ACHAW6_001898 [Cyclotella cf. meneghiniana]
MLPALTQSTSKMNNKVANSFERSLTRHCSIHPEVELHFADANCLKCSASLVKAAVKESEFSTAKLDRRQSTSKIEIDSKNSNKTGERKVFRSALQSNMHGMERNVPACKERYDQVTLKSYSPNAVRRQFDLGEVAGTFDTLPTDQETLIRIARLQIGDGAFVRRSDNVWTFARLKSRGHGPDASLVFTVAARGATKSFPLSHWSQYIRLAVENNCRKEDDFLADLRCEINANSDIKGSGYSLGDSENSLSSSICHDSSSTSHDSDAIANSSMPSRRPSRSANNNRRFACQSMKVMNANSACDLRQTPKEQRKVQSEANRSSKSNDGARMCPGPAAESFCSALKLIHTTADK